MTCITSKIIAITGALLISLSATCVAQKAAVYAFTYKITYGTFHTKDAMTNWVLQEVVKSARNECYADKNGVLTEFKAGRTEADEMAARNRDTIVDLSVNIKSASGVKKIYYSANTKMNILDDEGRKVKCQAVQQEPLINTGFKRKIAGRICTKWTTQKSAYQAIELWVSTEVPKEINPGYGIGQLPGGIVYINIKNRQFYTLSEMKKVNYRIPTYPCNKVEGNYNIFAERVNNTK